MKYTGKSPAILRWTARITGLIAVLFFLRFMIGEGMYDIRLGRARELMPFLPLLILSIAGYFIALIRERLGGRLMITGGFLMMAYLFWHQDYAVGAMYGIPFIFPGLLFFFVGTHRLLVKKGMAL